MFGMTLNKNQCKALVEWITSRSMECKGATVMSKIVKWCLVLCLCSSINLGIAEEVTKEQIKGLDEQVQDIKKDVLGISAELNQLEEKLLYPSNTYISFFVSLAEDAKFQPDAIKIKLDDKDVAHYIYSFKELEALQNGGVQRVFTGNVRTGPTAEPVEHNQASIVGCIIGDRGAHLTGGGRAVGGERQH